MNNKINLKIDNFYPFVNDQFMGITIEWSSNIGFGQYTIYKSSDSDKWAADSECMDDNEDKEFIKSLMELFIKELDIEN